MYVSMPTELAPTSHGGGSEIYSGRKIRYSGLMANCMCSHALACCENIAPFPDALQTCVPLQIWVRPAKSSSKSNSSKVRPRSQSSSNERCVFVCLSLCSQLVSDVGMKFTILLQVNPSRKADDGWTSCKYRGSLPFLQILHAAVSSKKWRVVYCAMAPAMGVHASEFDLRKAFFWPFCPAGCLWLLSVCASCAGEPLSIYRPQLENLLGNETRSGLTASPLRSHTTAPKVRSKKRPGRQEDSEYGEESSYDGGLEPSVGPGIEQSGRLSPVPHASNAMADLMTTTTSAPSPRRTRRARVPVKLEDDGTFDEEVSGRQAAKPAWSLPPVQADVAPLQPYKSDLLTKTFVQCENPECGKWRKVPVSLLDHQGSWVCAMNPDSR